MTSEKKDKMLTVRMTREDYKYLQIAAYMAGQKPSKLLRMLMDSAVNAVKVQEKKGAINLEDFEGLLND